MAEQVTLGQAIILTYECPQPDCEGEMAQTGRELPSNPPHYPHRCQTCGTRKNLDSPYPRKDIVPQDQITHVPENEGQQDDTEGSSKMAVQIDIEYDGDTGDQLPEKHANKILDALPLIMDEDEIVSVNVNAEYPLEEEESTSPESTQDE